MSEYTVKDCRALSGMDPEEADAARAEMALLRAEVERLREALDQITGQDDTELLLDPTWAKRVASAALGGKHE